MIGISSRVDEGARALYETVEHEGELIAIRQVGLASTGGVHRSRGGGWRTCTAAPPTSRSTRTRPVKPITREAFTEVWNSAPHDV
ncbi:hypothetical protein LZG04_28955 [Saccharothrix sp. S26]|uniref:hypothetical protein n=1 Tax=Saccharothrix sp. S26 TaxID=2907215 RepID=UPI001F3634B6|nr:hypothetical protein [Saccharothrix sp. S26]MCE6998797.1 hypothetical protein [Saccharothrix sp. S26]